MPDGDKFEKRLFGRGWKKLYHLACAGSSFPILRDRIISSSAAALNIGLAQEAIPNTLDALQTALEQEAWLQEGLFSRSNNAFLDLNTILRSMNLGGDFHLVEVLQNAARSVFIENKNACASISSEEIIDRFGEKLIVKTMEAKWLDKVRDGIMDKQKRSVPEQIVWEQDLREALLSAARKMMRNALRGKIIKKFRAPISRDRQRRMTLDSLNQGLTVLSNF